MAPPILTLEAFASPATVRLIVGHKDPTTLHVPDAILRSEPYFNNALRHGFAESNTGTITLSEESPYTILYYLQWRNTGALINERDPNDPDDYFLGLTKLWIFADMITNVKLRDCLLDAIPSRALEFHSSQSDKATLEAEILDAAIYAHAAGRDLRLTLHLQCLVVYMSKKKQPTFKRMNKSDIWHQVKKDVGPLRKKIERILEEEMYDGEDQNDEVSLGAEGISG